MAMCFLASTRSPDPVTKHGAILCNKNHQILGMGYNGFPRMCIDEEFPLSRPQKYDVIIHSEENCLLNSQNLLLGENYTMYITGFPCSRCFAKMMQCGVRNVIYGPLNSDCVQKEQKELVKKMSKMGNVKLTKYSGKVNIDCFEGLLCIFS